MIRAIGLVFLGMFLGFVLFALSGMVQVVVG